MLRQLHAARAGSPTFQELAKRIAIPLTATSPPGLIEALTVDPWSKAGKYALGWTYFCITLVFLVGITRAYHLWTDKLRQAMHKQEVQAQLERYVPDHEYAMGAAMETGRIIDQLFPRQGQQGIVLSRGQSHWSSIGFVNDSLALFRWIFYRPIPELRWRKTTILSFPSLAVYAILLIATAFVTLYCFLPQPLYWQSIQYGSPPLAIRAGMIAIAMTPWIVATAMKANLVSMVTGISHEGLAVKLAITGAGAAGGVDPDDPPPQAERPSAASSAAAGRTEKSKRIPPPESPAMPMVFFIPQSLGRA